MQVEARARLLHRGPGRDGVVVGAGAIWRCMRVIFEASHREGSFMLSVFCVWRSLVSVWVFMCVHWVFD